MLISSFSLAMALYPGRKPARQNRKRSGWWRCLRSFFRR